MLLFFSATFWTGDENLPLALWYVQNRSASFALEVDRGFAIDPLLIQKTPPSLGLHHKLLILGQLARPRCDVLRITTENAQRHKQQSKR